MADEEWMIEDGTTLDLEGVARLKVGLASGQVDILGHDETFTRVEVHSVSGRPLRIVQSGDRLEIDHTQVRWDDWLGTMKNLTTSARADVSLLVPRAVALKLGVASAPVLVTGLTSDVSLSSVSGDLVLDGVAGNVQLNSVSGEVSARDHEGAIAVHTVSGDVTASGEVRAFSCDAVSADVYLDLTGATETVSVNTVSGTLTARLGADVRVDYTIATASGRLQLGSQPVTVNRGRITGSIGDDGAPRLVLKANTVSGGVSLLTAVPA